MLRRVEQLNLAFNSLISIRAVHSLRHLTNLSLSHNALKSISLAPLAELPALAVLKLSHNQLTTLAPLGRCVSLVELWVPHNRVNAVAELAALQPVERLRRLVFSPNPLMRRVTAEDCRLTIHQLLPTLESLDGVTFTSAETDAATVCKPPQKGGAGVGVGGGGGGGGGALHFKSTSSCNESAQR
jgi:Leucine-rich repeat (LRR) protein